MSDTGAINVLPSQLLRNFNICIEKSNLKPIWEEFPESSDFEDLEVKTSTTTPKHKKSLPKTDLAPPEISLSKNIPIPQKIMPVQQNTDERTKLLQKIYEIENSLPGSFELSPPRILQGQSSPKITPFYLDFDLANPLIFQEKLRKISEIICSEFYKRFNEKCDNILNIFVFF